MNLIKSLLITSITALTLISSNNLLANNSIALGEGVNLIAVNGKEVNTEKLFNGKTQYELPNGLNQILVNYTAEVAEGSDLVIEHSKVFVLLFESKNDNLSLSAPKIKRAKELKEFEKNKIWLFKSSSKKDIKYKANIIEKNGFQLSRDFEKELERFNKSNSPAALPKNKIINPDNNNTTISVIGKENMTMNMLIYWYNQADRSTRKNFKELIKKNKL